MNASNDQSPLAHVSICICTYQRPEGLAQVLKGLARQEFTHSKRPELSIIVTDNEGNSQVKHYCESFCSDYFKELSYFHEPRRGISYARNSCLDNAPRQTDFIAMIDDDESPESNWLDQLLLAEKQTGADVIIGPTIPLFPNDSPVWIERSGFFNKPRNQDELCDLQANPPAATCNTLIRAKVLTDTNIRFHTGLALSGGEDALFFREIKLAGYSFVWAKNARVYETIPREKATFSYMWREEFRRGNASLYVKTIIRGNINKKPGPGATRTFREAIRPVKHVIGGIVGTLKALATWSPEKKNIAMSATRIARGMGMLAGLLGMKSGHYR